MKKFMKMFGAVGLLAGMMMASGCGDDAAPATQTKATAVTVTTPSLAAVTVMGGANIPVGTVVYSLPAATTTATAPGVTGTVNAVSIPASTQVAVYKLVNGVLTLTSASGTTATINVATPVNGTTAGVPVVKVGTTSFTVADAAGAVDISFAGADAFKLSGTGATVNIPVAKAPDNTTTPQVVAIKADGTTKTYTTGNTYTAATATNSGFVTVPNVTDFCWFVVNPKKANPSGTGSVSIF